jgi:hypothetical protein
MRSVDTTARAKWHVTAVRYHIVPVSCIASNITDRSDIKTRNRCRSRQQSSSKQPLYHFLSLLRQSPLRTKHDNDSLLLGHGVELAACIRERWGWCILVRADGEGLHTVWLNKNTGLQQSPPWSPALSECDSFCWTATNGKLDCNKRQVGL